MSRDVEVLRGLLDGAQEKADFARRQDWPERAAKYDRQVAALAAAIATLGALERQGVIVAAGEPERKPGTYGYVGPHEVVVGTDPHKSLVPRPRSIPASASATRRPNLLDAPRRPQEDIRHRRQVAAAYYVLRDLQSVPPLVVWWTELTWEQQDCGGKT